MTKNDIKVIIMFYVSSSVHSSTISIIYFKIMFKQLKINLSKLAKLNSILIPFKTNNSNVSYLIVYRFWTFQYYNSNRPYNP